MLNKREYIKWDLRELWQVSIESSPALVEPNMRLDKNHRRFLKQYHF